MNSDSQRFNKKWIGCIIGAVVITITPTLRTFKHNKVDAVFPLYVKQTGTPGAPKVVLIHGLTGQHSYWASLENTLAKDFEIYMPDLVGFGYSPWPDGPYTMNHHIEELSRVMPDGQSIVVGHSMGSLIAMEWAIRYPERVKNLFLLAPPNVDTRDELKEVLSKQSKVESIMSFDSFWAALVCHIHEVLGPGAYYFYRPFIESFIPDHIVKGATLHRWESYDGSLRNVVIETQLKSKIKELQVPFTIIVGNEDGYSKNEELIGAFGGIILAYEGGHNFIWESNKSLRALSDRIKSVK